MVPRIIDARHAGGYRVWLSFAARALGAGLRALE